MPSNWLQHGGQHGLQLAFRIILGDRCSDDLNTIFSMNFVLPFFVWISFWDPPICTAPIREHDFWGFGTSHTYDIFIPYLWFPMLVFASRLDRFWKSFWLVLGSNFRALGIQNITKMWSIVCAGRDRRTQGRSANPDRRDYLFGTGGNGEPANSSEIDT